jgi:hypothetical protein
MRIQQYIPLGLLLGGLLAIAPPVAAQSTSTGVGRAYVPIQGHTGIIQEPINTAEMYQGLEGIARVLGLAGVQNRKIYRMEAVKNMERGMPVVVHYEVDDNQTASAQGRVTSIDRAHGRIAVQYDDGRIDSLRVTQHDATPSLNVKGRRVVVYSSTKAGQPMVQYFKRKS